MRRCGGHQNSEASTRSYSSLNSYLDALPAQPSGHLGGAVPAAGVDRDALCGRMAAQRVMPDSQAVNRPDGFSAMTIWLLSLPKRLRTLLALLCGR